MNKTAPIGAPVAGPQANFLEPEPRAARAELSSHSMQRQRTPPAGSVSAVASHEAGHAGAITMGFRTAAWLPYPPPPLPVRYVEVTGSTPGETGSCVGADIYSTKWGIAPPFGDLMERQITIHLRRRSLARR